MKVFLANSLELNIFRRQMWRKRNNSKLHNYDQRSYLMCGANNYVWSQSLRESEVGDGELICRKAEKSNFEMVLPIGPPEDGANEFNETFNSKRVHFKAQPI